MASPVPINSTPMIRATTYAPPSRPSTKGAAITIGASATSSAAWMGRGTSLARVMSLIIVTVEHVFLCELGHRPPASTFCGMRERIRLDALLVERGLFESRSRAAAAVMAGEVSVDRRARAVEARHARLARRRARRRRRPRYVSRGGHEAGARARVLRDAGRGPPVPRRRRFDRRLHRLPAAARRRARDLRRRRLRGARLAAARGSPRDGHGTGERAQPASPAGCPTRPT